MTADEVFFALVCGFAVVFVGLVLVLGIHPISDAQTLLRALGA